MVGRDGVRDFSKYVKRGVFDTPPYMYSHCSGAHVLVCRVWRMQWLSPSHKMYVKWWVGRNHWVRRGSCHGCSECIDPLLFLVLLCRGVEVIFSVVWLQCVQWRLQRHVCGGSRCDVWKTARWVCWNNGYCGLGRRGLEVVHMLEGRHISIDLLQGWHSPIEWLVPPVNITCCHPIARRVQGATEYGAIRVGGRHLCLLHVLVSWAWWQHWKGELMCYLCQLHWCWHSWEWCLTYCWC
jgi:hypothetical protein